MSRYEEIGNHNFHVFDLVKSIISTVLILLTLTYRQDSKENVSKADINTASWIHLMVNLIMHGGHI